MLAYLRCTSRTKSVRNSCPVLPTRGEVRKTDNLIPTCSRWYCHYNSKTWRSMEPPFWLQPGSFPNNKARFSLPVKSADSTLTTAGGLHITTSQLAASQKELQPSLDTYAFQDRQCPSRLRRESSCPETEWWRLATYAGGKLETSSASTVNLRSKTVCRLLQTDQEWPVRLIYPQASEQWIRRGVRLTVKNQTFDCTDPHDMSG